jgi:hypothetical protein
LPASTEAKALSSNGSASAVDLNKKDEPDEIHTAGLLCLSSYFFTSMAEWLRGKLLL